MTYSNSRELVGKTLRQGDDVIFTVNDKKYNYQVTNRFLNSIINNSTIFRKLGMDRESRCEFCSYHYGYRHGGGDWPLCRSDDYEALARVVMALFRLSGDDGSVEAHEGTIIKFNFLGR